MLTCAVFAVVITAPAGAIFINTLGTKWLNHDENPQELEDLPQNANGKDDKTNNDIASSNSGTQKDNQDNKTEN